jgi:hypothetical protein
VNAAQGRSTSGTSPVHDLKAETTKTKTLENSLKIPTSYNNVSKFYYSIFI